MITFGSPVDTAAAMPLGIPEGVASRVANVLADSTLARNAVPAWMSRLGFRMLDPVKAARQQVDFVRQLHDREALLPRERQRRFLQADGWVAWPGPALADFMRQFIAHNRMLEGGFVIDDRLVTLADIDCPILTVVGEVDELAPAPAVRAIVRAAPRAEIFELALTAGHFGLVVGSASNATTWPTVAAWTRWRDANEELPAEVRRSEVAAELAEGPGAGRPGGLRPGAGGRRRLEPGTLDPRRLEPDDGHRPHARRGGAHAAAAPDQAGPGAPPHPDLAGQAPGRAGLPNTRTRSSSCSRTAPIPTPLPSTASTRSCAG